VRAGSAPGTPAIGPLTWTARVSVRFQDSEGSMPCVMANRPDPLDLAAMKANFTIGSCEGLDIVHLSVDSPSGDENRSPMLPVSSIFQPMPDTRHEDLEIHPSRELEEHYEIKQMLGHGGYGVVRQATCKIAGSASETGRCYAIKSVTHDHIETQETHANEVLFAWRVEHPYLVHLIETFQDNDYLHLVMELCLGGTLEEKMRSLHRQHGEPRGLPNCVLMRYVWEMVAGIAYLHHHRIAHRDCKPENYMLDRVGVENSPLKLVDFGIAVTIHTGQTLTERVGTPGYAAPEVSAGDPYNEKCDIWSLGAVSFLCAVGFPAFTGAGPIEIMKKVVANDMKFDPLRWDLVKPQMKSIIQTMGIRDQKTRPSANQLAENNLKWLMRCKTEDSRLGHPQPCCTVS